MERAASSQEEPQLRSTTEENSHADCGVCNGDEKACARQARLEATWGERTEKIISGLDRAADTVESAYANVKRVIKPEGAHVNTDVRFSISSGNGRHLAPKPEKVSSSLQMPGARPVIATSMALATFLTPIVTTEASAQTIPALNGTYDTDSLPQSTFSPEPMRIELPDVILPETKQEIIDINTGLPVVEPIKRTAHEKEGPVKWAEDVLGPERSKDRQLVFKVTQGMIANSPELDAFPVPQTIEDLEDPIYTKIPAGTEYVTPLESRGRSVEVIKDGQTASELYKGSLWERQGFSFQQFVTGNAFADKDRIIGGDKVYGPPGSAVTVESDKSNPTPATPSQPEQPRNDDEVVTPNQPRTDREDSDQDTEPEVESEPTPPPEPKQVVVLKEHYDYMRGVCGTEIPSGESKQRLHANEFNERADGLEQAIKADKQLEYLRHLQASQLKTIAEREGISVEEQVSNCMHTIAVRQGIDHHRMDETRAGRWQELRADFVRRVVEDGELLSDIEQEFEKAKQAVVNVNNRMAEGLDDLGEGLSDFTASQRAIRLLSGEGHRDILADVADIVAEKRGGDATAAEVLGQSLWAWLDSQHPGIMADPEDETIKNIGQSYLDGKVSFAEIKAMYADYRQQVGGTFDLMKVDRPGEATIDRIALEMLGGRTIPHLRASIAKNEAKDHGISIEEVYLGVLGESIEDEDIKQDAELMAELAQELVKSDKGGEAKVTVNEILELAASGGHAELEEVAVEIKKGSVEEIRQRIADKAVEQLARNVIENDGRNRDTRGIIVDYCNGHDHRWEWCACFASWSMKEAGINLPGRPGLGVEPGALNLMRDLKDHPEFEFHSPESLSSNMDLKPGDIVFYTRGGGKGHVGIVVRVKDGGLAITVDGNMGDRLDERRINVVGHERFVGMVRYIGEPVPEPEPEPEPEPTVEEPAPSNEEQPQEETVEEQAPEENENEPEEAPEEQEVGEEEQPEETAPEPTEIVPDGEGYSYKPSNPVEVQIKNDLPPIEVKTYEEIVAGDWGTKLDKVEFSRMLIASVAEGDKPQWENAEKLIDYASTAWGESAGGWVNPRGDTQLGEGKESNGPGQTFFDENGEPWAKSDIRQPQNNVNVWQHLDNQYQIFENSGSFDPWSQNKVNGGPSEEREAEFRPIIEQLIDQYGLGW